MWWSVTGQLPATILSMHYIAEYPLRLPGPRERNRVSGLGLLGCGYRCASLKRPTGSRVYKNIGRWLFLCVCHFRFGRGCSRRAGWAVRNVASRGPWEPYLGKPHPSEHDVVGRSACTRRWRSGFKRKGWSEGKVELGVLCAVRVLARTWSLPWDTEEVMFSVKLFFRYTSHPSD